MIKAERHEQDAILKFLEPHVEECVYLYLDIYQYGIGSDTIDVWYEPADGGYKIIVMKYFNGLQIYSPENDFEIAELAQIVQENDIDRIFAKKSTIEYIMPAFEKDFDVEFGSVLEFKKHRDFSNMYDLVEVATKEDIPELADLLLSDEENAKSYDKEELVKTFENLYETGMGKSFILRQDGKIVASVSISAQTDIFIIGAYTIVHKDYRDTLFGMVVDSYIINVAKGERRFFGFVVDPKRIKMFELLGNPVVAEYGKFLKK